MGCPALRALVSLLCLCPSLILGQEGGTCPGEMGLLSCVDTAHAHICARARCRTPPACIRGNKRWNERSQPGNTSGAWLAPNDLLQEWVVQERVFFSSTLRSHPLLFCTDVKIVGLGAQEKVAIIQSCPVFAGLPGPKGEPGSPAGRGRGPDPREYLPQASPPPTLPRSLARCLRLQDSGGPQAAQGRWDQLATKVGGAPPIGLSAQGPGRTQEHSQQHPIPHTLLPRL
jgi:hypothetical protein